MSKSKYYNSYTHQLCGNWDMRLVIDEINSEKRKINACARKKSVKVERKNILIPYSNNVLEFFADTSAGTEIVKVVDEWKKIDFNKELVYAAAQVKSVLGGYDLSPILLARYNIYLKITCKQNRLKCYEQLKINN